MHNTISVQAVSWLKEFEVIVIFLTYDPVCVGRKAREVNRNED